MDDRPSPQHTHDSVENHASPSLEASRETLPGYSTRSNIGVYDRPKRTVTPVIVIAAILLLLILSAILAILIL